MKGNVDSNVISQDISVSRKKPFVQQTEGFITRFFKKGKAAGKIGKQVTSFFVNKIDKAATNTVNFVKDKVKNIKTSAQAQSFF